MAGKHRAGINRNDGINEELALFLLAEAARAHAGLLRVSALTDEEAGNYTAALLSVEAAAQLSQLACTFDAERNLIGAARVLSVSNV